jgi:hypothetical protein
MQICYYRKSVSAENCLAEILYKFIRKNINKITRGG